MIGYDFTLFFADVKTLFKDFDEFADRCEEVDKECCVDYDTLDCTFYDFSLDFFPTKRYQFVKNCLERVGININEDMKNQYSAQQAFRNAMAAVW